MQKKTATKNDSIDGNSSNGTIDLRICDLPFDAMIIMGAAELIPYRRCGWLAGNIHILCELNGCGKHSTSFKDTDFICTATMFK